MSLPPTSPRSPLRADLRREIVETHKIIKANEKFAKYSVQNVQHLASQVAENPPNKDLNTRLQLAIRTQSAFQTSNVKAPLEKQLQNLVLDYAVLAKKGDMEKLARACYPDDAEKQKSFLQEVQSKLPNLSGQGVDITDLLGALSLELGLPRDSFSATFSSFTSNSGSIPK